MPIPYITSGVIGKKTRDIINDIIDIINDLSPGGANDKVKYNSEDTAEGYLSEKTVAGIGIGLQEGTGDDADKLVISNNDRGSFLSSDANTNNYSHLRKSIPSSDNRGEGDVVVDINAGETLAFPTLVCLSTSGTWIKADPNAIATTGLLGMALESKTSGQALKVLLRGFVRDDDWNWGTIGGAIFANATTAGTYTQTAPSGEDDVVVIVGWATHADRMYFCPDNTRIEFRAS